MKVTERNWQMGMEAGMGEKTVDFFFNVGHMFRGVVRSFII